MKSLHCPNHSHNMRSCYDLMLYIEPLGFFRDCCQLIRNQQCMKGGVPEEGVVHYLLFLLASLD
jgi:hypothetical protein